MGYGISDACLLPTIALIFGDTALLWYRNSRDRFTTWDEFVKAFQDQFYPPRYAFRLEEEIRTRIQGLKENVAMYVTAMMTLLRRHGHYSQDQQVDRLHENLRPEYKLYIKRREVKSVYDILEMGKEYEQVVSQKDLIKPAINKPAEITPRPAPLPIARPTLARSESPPLHLPNAAKPLLFSTRPGPRVIDQEEIEKRLTASPGHGNLASVQYNRAEVCWNCGQPGHWRFHCKNPFRKFCSRCNKPDVYSSECDCRRAPSGNANRPPR
ncbi:hypothetical protein PPYR_15761, partial [Photinus pyralis]